jgi:DNA modification methylase
MLELNKIYCGDNLKLIKQLDDNSIDLTVTSPPYDNLRDYKGYSWDFENLAKELYRVTKQGGVVVWVVGDATINGSETGTSFKQALYFKEIGFNLHDTMIYEKSGMPFPAVGRYHQMFEYMFIFCKGKIKTFNPIKDEKKIWGNQGRWGKSSERQKDGNLIETDYKPNNNEYKMRSNIWRIINAGGFGQTDKDAYKHPATFHEKLANDHIISWSNENDIVLDPFMGSGTTAKMAILNRRKFIGFELSQEYCDIANERIKEPKQFMKRQVI